MIDQFTVILLLLHDVITTCEEERKGGEMMKMKEETMETTIDRLIDQSSLVDDIFQYYQRV